MIYLQANGDLYELDAHHLGQARHGGLFFDLFAAAVALYKPWMMFPCYPPAIMKAAKEPPTEAENRFYWLWICFGELLPLLLYGAVSTVEGGTTGFWRLALTG